MDYGSILSSLHDITLSLCSRNIAVHVHNIDNTNNIKSYFDIIEPIAGLTIIAIKKKENNLL